MGELFVLSDIHGHLSDTRSVLGAAGLLDPATDRWTGGDAQLWVLGDLLDRGPDGAGVVHLMRRLQADAPTQVHVLLGNHEALALGYRLVRDHRLERSWRANGGLETDQDRLSEDDIEWMRQLPAMGVAGDHLLVHADCLAYVGWGETVEAVNDVVRHRLGTSDPDVLWGMWADLTERYEFLGAHGRRAAAAMLHRYGARRIVHGHSIIATLRGGWPSSEDRPLEYADGLVLAIDGGRYAGGPLLLVSLGDGTV